MIYSKELKINGRAISQTEPTYFIADIAANHDGDLNRALDLISRAKEAGANCAKFQHFNSETIVSPFGFSKKENMLSHQKNWEKSVTDVYDQYHTKKEWDQALVQQCKAVEIDFMTTPYNVDAIQRLDRFLPAYKIGSGDITNYSILQAVAKKGKPVLLAAGASTFSDVRDAIEVLLVDNEDICLMQCNTNYTADLENFKHINLNVLKSFATMFPGMPLGLSDHTPGHTTVIGAVALGARVIEKHFTDDCSRIGPDHKFAMDPVTWRNMVQATRELEFALGDGIKKIEHNELETVLIQRRACRLRRTKELGSILTVEDLEFLRPCEKDALSPMDFMKSKARKLTKSILAGESIRWGDLE
ncbi:N-acetylneuraminate synthase family protein [Lentibacter algarum]|uniref:N-acetylneuraminate synthase family protein n=1 Tax=Lentibacter algarum TaxID=576131 RepID=UPI00339DA712